VFWALDLSKRGRPAEFRWKLLPPWPGPPRVLPVAAAQRTSAGDSFFLFSGRVPHAGKPTQILTDAYVFEPKKNAWRMLPPSGGGKGVSLMAGTAAAVGDDEVLLFGGDRGELFLELEAHDLAIDDLRKKLAAAHATDDAALQGAIDRHLSAKRKIYERHPGFGREVFSFDTRRETWRVVQRSPIPPQVTTTAVTWGDAVVIPSGEIRPGVRTPNVVRVVPVGR
jgi:N-acetylneuraminic acid mutarotase